MLLLVLLLICPPAATSGALCPLLSVILSLASAMSTPCFSSPLGSCECWSAYPLSVFYSPAGSLISSPSGTLLPTSSYV